MKVLAVESSGMVAAVAIANKDKLLGEFLLDHRKTHSQQLMPIIDELLDKLDTELGEIDLFAASKGPGSFTGLRIGIATIKALAQSVDRPVIGVPTLDGLAYNLSITKGLICPIIDARRDQVYTALYRSQSNPDMPPHGRPERLWEYRALPVAELIQELKVYDETVIFNGDGVKSYWDLIKKEMGERALSAPINLISQRASSIACLALGLADIGYTQNYTQLLPFYLRKSQAEQKFVAKS